MAMTREQLEVGLVEAVDADDARFVARLIDELVRLRGERRRAAQRTMGSAKEKAPCQPTEKEPGSSVPSGSRTEDSGESSYVSKMVEEDLAILETKPLPTRTPRAGRTS
jgi:hypothetical protein